MKHYARYMNRFFELALCITQLNHSQLLSTYNRVAVFDATGCQTATIPSITLHFICESVPLLVEVLSHAICNIQYYVNRGFPLLFH